jgi:hypothetical protein
VAFAFCDCWKYAAAEDAADMPVMLILSSCLFSNKTMLPAKC